MTAAAPSPAHVRPSHDATANRRSRRRTRRVIGPVLLIGGSTLVCAGAAAPWLRNGQVSRSAFSLARHVRELGVLHTSGGRIAIAALFFAPAVVGMLVVMLSLGWRRLAGAVGVAVALVGVGAGVVGLRSATTAGAGPVVTLIGGLAAAAGVVSLAVGGSSGTVRPADAVSMPERAGPATPIEEQSDD